MKNDYALCKQKNQQAGKLGSGKSNFSPGTQISINENLTL